MVGRNVREDGRRRRRGNLFEQRRRGLLFDLLGRDRLLGKEMANRTGIALVRPRRASLARGLGWPRIPAVAGPAALLVPARNGQAPATRRWTGRLRPAALVVAVDVKPSPGSDRQKIGGQEEKRGCRAFGGHRLAHVGGHTARSLSIIGPRAPQRQARTLEGCWMCDEQQQCAQLSWLKPVHGDRHLQNLRTIRQKGKAAFAERKATIRQMLSRRS